MAELGFLETSSMPMYRDNQLPIYITNNPLFHQRTKHIKVNCHFVRDCVTSEMICTPFIPPEQLANIFNKILSKFS